MNSDGHKEVYFDRFCSTCLYSSLSEYEDPCDECLGDPTNLYSHRPTKYERDYSKSKGASNESKEKTTEI